MYKGRARIDGKVVIVTGANTGIGKETAMELVNRGQRGIPLYIRFSYVCYIFSFSVKIIQSKVFSLSGSNRTFALATKQFLLLCSAFVITTVSRSHSSFKTYAGRMLNRRAAASAAVLVLRGWPTTLQTDGQTPDRCITLTAIDAVSVKK